MIPVLGIIIVLSYFMYQYSGADPVNSMLLISGVVADDVSSSNFEKEYKTIAKKIGRDLPLFYLSIVPSYFPDTLHRIVLPDKKRFSIKLLREYKNWENIDNYLGQLDRLNLESKDITLSQDLRQAIFQFNLKVSPKNLQRINASISKEINYVSDDLKIAFFDLKKGQELLNNNRSSFFYPKILFHKNRNQFHIWFKSILTGNFGVSLTDGRSVKSKLFKSLQWTLSLSILSILLASFLSICIGFITAYKKNSFVDKLIYFALFILFSIPLFWLATLMIVFFTSDNFGKWTNIFPSVGVFYTGEGSIFKQFAHNFSLLILPVFCMALQATAYLGRQVRSSILQQANEPYFLSALSKGMSRKSALWNHVLPNALLPFITIITAAIPASLAGSLVVEVLFNIPGTGRLMYQSILNDDWNMISIILIIISVATMLFYLIGDILYTYVNPRIKLES